MALNHDLLGKIYRDDQPWTVEADGVRAYALATNSDNPLFLDSSLPTMVAPPIYGVVVSRGVLQSALLDPELGVDTAHLVHNLQDCWFHELLRPGDQVTSEVRVAEMVDSRAGELLDLAVRTERADGTLLYEATVGVLIRAGGRRPGQGERKGSSTTSSMKSPFPRRVPDGVGALFEATFQIAADQSLRYADASGDHNPIHKDEAFAREVGLPGRILHGLCTMAMAHNALIDGAAAGDPGRLRRMRGRFSRPVLMGDTLVARGYRLPDHEPPLVLYEVLNQDGKPILKEGAAELS